MATGMESALVKPVVDGFLSLLRMAKGMKLKANAEKALTEAIRELLLAPSDLKSAEVKIAIAKAAGIINTDLILAEELLSKSKTLAKKAAPAKRAVSAKAKILAPKKVSAGAKSTTPRKLKSTQ